MKYICIALIKLYKKTVGKVKRKTCIYAPTCSAYGIESFEKHGFFVGGWLTFKRILRCAPWGKGGFDPVPHNYKGEIKWSL